MNDLSNGRSVWSLTKTLAGFLVLGILGLAVIGTVLGIAGVVISFAVWVSLRLLPLLVVGAVIYWIARETGWLKRSGR